MKSIFNGSMRLVWGCPCLQMGWVLQSGQDLAEDVPSGGMAGVEKSRAVCCPRATLCVGRAIWGAHQHLACGVEGGQDLAA